MLRLFLFISILLSSLIITVDVSASVTYTPGAIIAMTGSNSEVRFDVAAPLMGYDATVPALVTGTRTFTGAFYGSGIGWINFSTGSYQVLLNCGVQSLGSLTSNCTLTGTGWSENVGDIYFSSGTTVTYDRTTGLLSGSVITFAGDLSLTGIILPLKPVELNETSMIAHHNATLTVSGAWMYEGSSSAWNGKVTIDLGIQSITGINGIYTPVDFSLAGTYTITIEDPNSSKTAISGFIVSPGVLSTTLDNSHYATTFCSMFALSTFCPDSTLRTATTLVQIPPTGPVVANGNSYYEFQPKIRDTYGNRISIPGLDMIYESTVNYIQTSDNFSITGMPCMDPIQIGGLGFFKACGGTWKNNVRNTDGIYRIMSNAPTNTSNAIHLSSATYTSGSTVIPLPFSTAPLTFTPLYTATISAPAPTIGIPHTFTATVIKNDATTPITPTIINTLKIGGGNLAEWKNLSSIPGATCVNYQGSIAGDRLCDWNTFTEKASIATPSSANFIFTGTYELIGGFPPVAPTDINTYIYYHNGTSDILYSVPSTTISQAITPTLRLRIFGQSGKWMNLGPQNRVDLINSIRKNIALLSRNRTDYTTADHIISTGNKTITNADFSPGNKRSIIVVGGDISITQNIPKYTHPIAIIALTDANGNGGNITISGSVTDIHSTLIAEHAILSETSNKQLYINGSVISSNPPQDIPPTTCPYFVTGPCISTNYDLPEFRSTYDSTAPNASIGGSMYFAPLIIEIDPRLITDAPPAINK